MKRSRYHPHQIMCADGLRVGEEYSFVKGIGTNGYAIRRYLFSGAFPDASSLAPGVNLNDHGVLAKLNAPCATASFTVHQDGWLLDLNDAVIHYWRGHDWVTYDFMSTWLGEGSRYGELFAIIPEGAWDADPNLRLCDAVPVASSEYADRLRDKWMREVFLGQS